MPIITKEGRVSFPSVFEKSDFNGDGKGKYEVTLVFDKDVDISDMKEAARAAVKGKWGNKPPSNLRSPFRLCGDKPEHYAEEFDPKDIFVAFRSNGRPGVVDSSTQPIIDAEEIYPGCWARVSTNAYAYDFAGNRGVAFGLNNMQKIRDDDGIGGVKTEAKDDFEAIAGSSEDPAAYTKGESWGDAPPDDDPPF